MPDPVDLLFSQVHRSNASLLDKVQGKDAEIAKLSADLRTARAAYAAAAARGDRTAIARSQRSIDSLNDKVANARNERRTLDRDHADLIDRLAMRESCDAPADVPLLLLPVRIETRFNAARNALRIRIYPDEIHVDRLDRGLSDKEASAGQAYWTQLWTRDPAATQAEAWNNLVAVVGASRAHWVARAMTPQNIGDLGTGVPTFPAPTERGGGAALARLLPDRFVAIAEQRGTRSRAVGSAIPPEVRIGLLSPEDVPLVEQDGLKILPGTEWIADFDAAVAKGLALTLPLARAGAVDRLIVAGVRRSRDPVQSAVELSSLLEAHWESDGLAFLPQGTPTNNTEAARAAWQRRIAKSAPPVNAAAIPEASNAATLSNILGLDAPWLAAVDHALEQEQADAAAMNCALWPATLGQFLDSVDKGNEAIRPAVIEQIRGFHYSHVRGRGPVPALRIGSQPYGILPVSNFATVWEDAPTDTFGKQLTSFLRKLRPNWVAGTSDLAHVASGEDLRQTMDQLLGHAGVSYGVRARRCLSGTLLGVVGQVTTAAKEATDIEALLTRMLQEAIGNFSYANLAATLDDKARPVLLPYTDDTRDAAFVTALRSSGNGGNISSVFQALVAIAAARLSAKRRPGRDFIDHLRASTKLPASLRDAIVRQMIEPGNADPPTLDNLRDALPGANDPVARPAPRSFAMDAMHEASFASYFDTASSTVARDYLTVLVADEFLLTETARAKFLAALDYLSKEIGDPSNQSRHLLVGETLDTVSHRLDAWITGAISRRLAHQRTAKPTGLSIGAFAYVENLVPRQTSGTSDGGYILTPSLTHATTAGILRAAHLSHKPNPGQRNPFAIGLPSADVRDALYLIDGIRQGQPLGALLGYRVERGLQDRGFGYLVLNLRSVAPLTQGKLSDYGETIGQSAQEVVSAANIVDGLRLVELWRQPGGPDAIRAKLASRPENNPYLPSDVAWPEMTVDIWNKVEAEIRKLDASVDAVADLLLAESVHQVAQGNLARAAATMDASGRGDVAPPEPDVISSMRGGQPVSHRLLVIGRPGGWSVDAPRARLAPGLEGWAAERLGDQARIVVGFASNGEAIRIPAGSLAALDLVALSDDPASAARRACGTVSFAPADPADSRLGVGDVALADMLTLADGMRRILATGRVANGSDFCLPGAPVAYDPDPAGLASLLTRLNETALLLSQRREALAALIASPSVDVDDLSRALVMMTDFGIATPSVSRAQLGETALLADAEARRRLSAYRALADTPLDAEGLAQRAQALMGADFLLPIPQIANANATFEVALDPPKPAAIRRYLGDIGTVRGQVRTFTDHLLLCGSLDVTPRLTVLQLGGESGRWIAEALPDGAHTPNSAVISIIADAPEAVPEALAGLVIDDWTETLPRRTLKGEADEAKGVLETTAGVAINANAPNVQPPQTMLLGISPDGARWSDDRVFDLVTETMEMARMRLVTLETVPLAARILPAIYTQSWSLQGEKTIDWSKFGDVFLKASLAEAPLRAFAMVEEG